VPANLACAACAAASATLCQQEACCAKCKLHGPLCTSCYAASVAHDFTLLGGGGPAQAGGALGSRRLACHGCRRDGCCRGTATALGSSTAAGTTPRHCTGISHTSFCVGAAAGLQAARRQLQGYVVAWACMDSNECPRVTGLQVPPPAAASSAATDCRRLCLGNLLPPLPAPSSFYGGEQRVIIACICILAFSARSPHPNPCPPSSPACPFAPPCRPAPSCCLRRWNAPKVRCRQGPMQPSTGPAPFATSTCGGAMLTT